MFAVSSPSYDQNYQIFLVKIFRTNRALPLSNNFWNFLTGHDLLLLTYVLKYILIFVCWNICQTKSDKMAEMTIKLKFTTSDVCHKTKLFILLFVLLGHAFKYTCVHMYLWHFIICQFDQTFEKTSVIYGGNGWRRLFYRNQ